MKDDVNEWNKAFAQETYYSGFFKFGMAGVHKLMEKGIPKNKKFKKVLELGGYYGNHHYYLKNDYEEYYKTDLLYGEKTFEITDGSKIYYEYLDARKVDKLNKKFDRVISTCLIVHLENPKKILQDWRSVVNSDGYITICVQLEQSFLLTFIQKFFSRPKFKKLGYNFDEIINTNHLHYPRRIDYFINDVFKNDSIKKYMYPFRFLPWFLNTTAVYQIKLS